MAPRRPSLPSAPRDAALFDLAINRAAVYARRSGALHDPVDASRLERALLPWVASTRFAYRIEIDVVVACLSMQGARDGHWAGGRAGGWTPGRPRVP